MNNDETPLELSQERTRLSADRTRLARERTFSSWIRTSLTAIAAGFAVAQLLTSVRPRGAFVAIGSTFVIAGITTLLLAFPEYLALLRQREASGWSRVPRWLAVTMVTAVVAATVAGLLLIVLNAIGVIEPNE